MAMTAKIVGKKLYVEIDLETPRPSSSEKNLIVASTGGGQKTDAKVDGCPLTISLNAYYKPAK